MASSTNISIRTSYYSSLAHQFIMVDIQQLHFSLWKYHHRHENEHVGSNSDHERKLVTPIVIIMASSTIMCMRTSHYSLLSHQFMLVNMQQLNISTWNTHQYTQRRKGPYTTVNIQKTNRETIDRYMSVGVNGSTHSL